MNYIRAQSGYFNNFNSLSRVNGVALSIYNNFHFIFKNCAIDQNGNLLVYQVLHNIKIQLYFAYMAQKDDTGLYLRLKAKILQSKNDFVHLCR